MKQLFHLVAYAALSLTLVSSATASKAAGKLDFSGTYSLDARKGGTGDSIIQVAQKENSVEVTRVEQGKSTTNIYSLDGSEGTYTTSSGGTGKGKAYFKGKFLILENVVVSRPQPSAPVIRLHSKEQWQLSTDSKTLTIKTSYDSPDVSSEISNVVFESINGIMKYVRNSP